MFADEFIEIRFKNYFELASCCDGIGQRTSFVDGSVHQIPFSIRGNVTPGQALITNFLPIAYSQHRFNLIVTSLSVIFLANTSKDSVCHVERA